MFSILDYVSRGITDHVFKGVFQAISKLEVVALSLGPFAAFDPLHSHGSELQDATWTCSDHALEGFFDGFFLDSEFAVLRTLSVESVRIE